MELNEAIRALSWGVAPWTEGVGKGRYLTRFSVVPPGPPTRTSV